MEASGRQRILHASTLVDAPPMAVFEFLAALDNHWRLADRWIEVVSLDGPSGGAPDRGVVRMRGPLGVGRTARTRVLEAHAPHRLRGSAQIGDGTIARVGWDLEEVEGATLVRLAATVENAGPLDRVLLRLGARAWLRRRFRSVLNRLRDHFDGVEPVTPMESTILEVQRA